MFYIETKQDLIDYFYKLHTTYSSNSAGAVLMNDIDLEYADIKTADYTFIALFDGQGHTIKNIKYNLELFNTVGKNGIIKDVVFENVHVDNATPFVRNNYGTISGVQLKDVEVGKNYPSTCWPTLSPPGAKP